MNTIWSKIIWEKLGKKDYEINKRPPEESESLIIEWVKNSSKEEVLETIRELSLGINKNIEYYDGNFHEIEMRDDQKGVWIHDTMILPLILELFMLFPEHLEDMNFIKSFTEEYLKKMRSTKINNILEKDGI